MRAKLSILGMYNHVGDIFDDMVLPADLDRSKAINTILYKCAELSLVYTEPETLKMIIGLWSTDHLENWSRMLLALTEEYNPLHNYDRHESWSEDESASGTTGATETHSTVKNAKVTNKEKIAGFDAASQAAMVPSSESETETDSGTLQTVHNATDSTERENSRTGHLYGNIGVTTSMQMLREEIEGREKYSIYDLIATDFKREFCICIY